MYYHINKHVLLKPLSSIYITSIFISIYQLENPAVITVLNFVFFFFWQAFQLVVGKIEMVFTSLGLSILGELHPLS